jgi:hypothetical protein
MIPGQIILGRAKLLTAKGAKKEDAKIAKKSRATGEGDGGRRVS